VLAGVTEAGQGSNGGYGHVSRGTLGTRRWGNGVLPTNTGIVACAVRDAGLGASPGVGGVIRCGPSDRGRAFPWSAPRRRRSWGGEGRVPAAAPASIRTARVTLADGPRTHGGSLNSHLVLSRDLNIALHAGQERTRTPLLLFVRWWCRPCRSIRSSSTRGRRRSRPRLQAMTATRVSEGSTHLFHLLCPSGSFQTHLKTKRQKSYACLDEFRGICSNPSK
jgi:hypothetical protein